jgi:hypothetical protein
MVAAGVVAGAVAVGGVTGALIGIPGQSGATTSSESSSTTAPSGSSSGANEAPDGGRHGPGFFGLRFGSDGVFAAAAEALNLSTEELMAKLRDGETTIADVAEQQNVDVQTVIDAMEAVASKNIEDLVNNPLPGPPDGFKGGPGRGHGFAFGFGFGLRESSESIADALGMTTDELRDAIRGGQSIADIAKSKNVDLDTIADTLVNDANERIDQAVQDEKLTQEQADEIKSDLKERITDLLNGELPDFGEGMHGFGGFRGRGMGPGGPGGAWPGAPEAPESPEASPSSIAS